MTTLAEVIEDTRNDFLVTARDEIDILDGAINALVETITVTDGASGLQHGTVLSIDLELLRVRTVTGTSATVLRGWGGSTAATHVDGSIVYVNPKVPDYRVFRAVNAELDSLSSPANGLFRIAALDLTYQSGVMGYDLAGATNVIDILDVNYDQPGIDRAWAQINRDDWRLERSMATSAFASGYGLVFNAGGSPSSPIRVRYKTGYTRLAALADDVEAVSGLHSEAHDILGLGAAIRLGLGRENQRNLIDAQSQPRRSEEVPAGAVSAGVAGLRRLRDQRIAEEAARLTQQWGT